MKPTERLNQSKEQNASQSMKKKNHVYLQLCETSKIGLILQPFHKKYVFFLY